MYMCICDAMLAACMHAVPGDVLNAKLLQHFVSSPRGMCIVSILYAGSGPVVTRHQQQEHRYGKFRIQLLRVKYSDAGHAITVAMMFM